MRMKQNQAGFNIIEVMVVTVCIGVLTAVALPTFRLNTAKAKVSEALLSFGNCKNIITEVYMGGGDPAGAGNWGCEIYPGPASQYVSTIQTSDEGIIRIEMQGDPRLTGGEIALAPLTESGTLPGAGDPPKTWRCGNPNDLVSPTYRLDPKYLPNSCQGN